MAFKRKLICLAIALALGNVVLANDAEKNISKPSPKHQTKLSGKTNASSAVADGVSENLWSRLTKKMESVWNEAISKPLVPASEVEKSTSTRVMRKKLLRKVAADQALGKEVEDFEPENLQEDGAELIYGLGETQIAYLNQFQKSSTREWTVDQLQDLRGFINTAVQQNPDVISAKAAKLQAEFSVREAKASFYPQLNVQSQRGVVKSDPSSVLGTPARDYKSYSMGLVLRQMLFDFGSVWNSVDAGSARDEQTLYKSLMTRSEVALKSIQAHHELMRAKRQAELAKKNLESRESILELVTKRQELGGGTISDVVRAGSRVADAVANLDFAKQRLGNIEASFKELFGELGREMEVQNILIDIPLDKDLLEEISRRSVDSYKVKMSLAARNAAEYDLKSQVAKGLPSLNLEVSSTKRDMALADPYVPGFDRSIYLVVRHNFYTGGADTAKEDQYRQRLVQAEEDLVSSRREAQRVFDQAQQEVGIADMLVKSRVNAVKLSANSLRMIREQFAYRRGSLLDLLTAQESLNSAGRDMIDAQIDSAQAKFKLLYASSLINKFFALD